MKNISFRNTIVTGGFWKIKQDMVRSVTAMAVYNRFKETGRFSALKCTWKEGDPLKPHFFFDSDVAKWIEGVAYLLEKGDEPELRALTEEAIDDICRNMDETGYFNSHFLVTRQEMRFRLRTDHELYCAGHLIEAAVAYYKATGERRFLDAMCRYADLIDRVFRVEQSAAFVTPGHPEIELALVKLYEATGEKRYLTLAKFFVDEHGKNLKEEKSSSAACGNEIYNQDEMLLRDRHTIDGHAVRALYLASGAADVARLYEDKDLLAACERMFDNATTKRMYITGGVGSTYLGEAFTVDYDLPTREAYAETCAAISLVYFAARIQLVNKDKKYADVIERVIYNGFLSGTSMDGKAFFYENPLEIDPAFNNVNRSTIKKARFPITQRKEVFSCSCCPPNIVRFIPSIADYAYTYDDETLYVQQFIDSTTECEGMKIAQKTAYPANGKVQISCESGGRRVAIRIPWWCKNFVASAEYTEKDGYAVFEPSVKELEIEFAMPVITVRPNKRIHASAGKIAVMRGPVVYCAEAVDNGKDLAGVRIDRKGSFMLGDNDFILPSIQTTGYTTPDCDELYDDISEELVPIDLTFIPYYAFANRGESEMRVWLQEK